MSGKPKFSETVGVVVRDPNAKLYADIKQRLAAGEPLLMVRRMGANMIERKGIEAFMTWLINKLESRDEGFQSRDLNVEKLLDEYYNIDRRQLDLERQAILDQHRDQSGS